MALPSTHLQRTVTVDLYLPPTNSGEPVCLLLINDGQDMDSLGLAPLLAELYESNRIRPLLCAAIHAGPNRKLEYGTAHMQDYKGRGSLAPQYSRFIIEELLPGIRSAYAQWSWREQAFAGFSLGALSALDIVWNHPQQFSTAGLFSGSFWWRSRDKLDAEYRDENDRIMHRQISQGIHYPWLRFFFECGGADESEDRNQNGVIDSIDDTLDLIRVLTDKGYDPQTQIRYLQLDEGRHDISTWAMAMPEFIEWGWGNQMSR